MMLAQSVVFKIIIIELSLLVYSEDKIVNNEVIEVIAANDSNHYPDYRIQFSIDITKNNTAFNSSFNDSDFIIVDDSRLPNLGKFNINVLKTKEKN